MAENSTNIPVAAKAENEELRDIMKTVYSALSEKGYNPVNQLVGYILSEDPTYITSYNGARALIRKVDRDELLACLIRDYLNN
jgi:YD repeat-containing protein